MTDCDALIERLDADAHTQVHLALIAESEPVAAMHLDLALFSKKQARVAEDLCEESVLARPIVPALIGSRG